jgi:hypothetical protein
MWYVDMNNSLANFLIYGVKITYYY